MPAFLKTKPLNEDTIEGFLTWAERKLKGYSANEVDLLAKKTFNIKKESDKLAVLERINKAIKDAEEKRNDTDDDEKKELIKSHLEVLKKIKQKAEASDPFERVAKEKEEEEKKKHDEENNQVNSNKERTIHLE